jgi:alpha-L-fucosidase
MESINLNIISRCETDGREMGRLEACGFGIRLIMPLVFLSMSAWAQPNSRVPGKPSAGYGNYVRILPTDKEPDIIRKAAGVVPSPRQLRWQELELTAFFHFGINTFTDKEWGSGKEDISLFDPTQLDARQWVRIAKESGIQQVILTAKHHDGFCLWPSQFTEHSVQHTPWKNGKGDVVKEVSDACREYGIGFGIYLSPWDRNSPSYGDSIKYNAYFEAQLTELLSNYGRVDEVWFDGANGEGPNGKKQVYDFAAWYKLIRRLQPTATIAIMGPDVRWVGTESGQGRLTEWSVLPVDGQMQDKIAAGSQKDITFAPKGDLTGDDLGGRSKIMSAKALIWYPAETDVSIRPGWFYHQAEDNKVKTPDQLLDIYFSSVGRNGVLLLNIPPDKDGLISAADSSSLAGWRKKIQGIFAVNLARGASLRSSNGLHMEALTDGVYDTYFTTRGKDTATTIDIEWKEAKTFDVLLLQENIRIGQRIEQFVLEYKDGDTWKKITEGTTVGYKRLLRFPPVTATSVKLRIESSRLNPTLSALGLYKIPD